MHDAVVGVTALAGERPPTGRTLVESRPVGNEVGHRAIPVGDDGTHRLGITQPGSGHQRVTHVGVD